MAALLQCEDVALRRVLAISFDKPGAEQSPSPPIVVLSALAQELRSEQQSRGESGPLLLGRNLLDRVIVARLIEEAPQSYPLAPFHYLIGCYVRATDGYRLEHTSSPEARQKISEALGEVKDLVVSYAGLCLTANIIPQPPKAEERGSLQLLDSIDAHEEPVPEGVAALPVSFLEDFAAKHDDEQLQSFLEPIMIELRRRAAAMTILGSFNKLLQALSGLAKVKPIANAIVQLPQWDPSSRNGRVFQQTSILGAFFAISTIPDPQAPLAQPNVGDQYFSSHESQSQQAMNQSFHALQLRSNDLCNGLHGVVRTFLRKDTREAMLKWFASALELNAGRARMNINPSETSSHGFCINLSRVLLQLCEPFVDPNLGKAWEHTDANYVLVNTRIDFTQDTKLGLTSEEERGVREKALADCMGQKPTFHFICECFFLTLKSLHLGLLKAISSSMTAARRINVRAQEVEALETFVGRAASDAQRQHAQRLLTGAKRELDVAKKEQLCFQCVLGDKEVWKPTISYYRLAATWMLRIVTGGTTVLELPLPEPAPQTFSMLPEYFVEDIAEAFQFTGHLLPQVLQAAKLHEVIMFVTALMGSMDYVKNPYLRSKLAEVLHICLPESAARTPRGPRFRPPGTQSLSFIFDGNPLVMEHLVPSLLKLYVDIEFTGRDNVFHEKFHMRSVIGDILMYLWGHPGHRETWVNTAKAGERGVYMQFCNMLINDSIYLLDESLKKVQDMRDSEQRRNQPDWTQLSPQDRQQQEHSRSELGNQLKQLLYLAKGCIETLHYSTKEIQAPFLLPEMVERVAAMLNYFLKYLTGPERRKLRISKEASEEYNFRPKELLVSILEIFLHLASADVGAGKFVGAIAADGMSYRDEMFHEALVVVEHSNLLPPNEVALLEDLAKRVQAAAAEGAKEEEIFGDIPDEFLDPIQYTLMRDPVILTTSGNTLDRKTITRHLLSDAKDPFNRMPLTVDQLQPNKELKQRIDEWVAHQKASRSG